MSNKIFLIIFLLLLFSYPVYALSFQDVTNFFSSIFNSIASFFNSAFSVLLPKSTPTGGGGGGGGSSGPPSCSASLSLSVSGKDTCTITSTVTASNCDNRTYEIKNTACTGTISSNSFTKTCTWTVTPSSYTYSLYVNNQYTTSRSVTCSASPPPACSDGTLYGQCSSTKPKYCSSGTLIDKCSQCGCPSGKNCNTTTNSCYTVQKCSDGTVYNQCSSNKPKYCSSGTLINKCSQCGCPSGQNCNATTESCYTPSVSTCDSQCKAQGYGSGSCEVGSVNTNLAVIPDDWGNYNPSSWSGYGYDPQIVFLSTSVERTPGNPSIWFEFPHTSADMNGARECDGIWYNVSVGDHIVFKCWEKTGLSQNPAYNNDPTDSYGVGARIGMDLYAPNPNRPGYIMIVAGALVNGLGDVNGNVISGHFASAGSDVPCNTSTWTQQVIDYIVPSGYGITQVVGWLQMRPETGDSVQGWFADCELYINPISSNCQSGETSIGQDGCSSGQTCCCSSSSTSKPIGIYTTSWNFGEMDANTLASTFDMSQSWWVEPKDDYSAKMNQVHALNPSYKALVYRNVGSIYDYSTDEWNLANSSGWLLKNTSGDFCRSPTWSSDYLVDFGNPDYQAWVAQKIKSWINQYPFFDGVMCDGGFEQAEIELEWASGTKPVNPRTGNPFTDQEVVDYHAALLNKIIDVVGTSKLFLPNGIWSGNSFSDSGSGSRYRDLLAKVPRLNAIMSEGAWPSMYNTGWYSEQDWLNTIKMVQWIQDNFLKDHFERKFVAFAATDVVPTGATREQLIKFGYCSMMLSIKYFDGRNNLALNSLPDKPDWSSTEPLLQRLHALDLGNPSSDYYNISQTSVYARDFASGKILVNPSTSSYTINLGGSYKTLDGRTVSSITMNAHTGEILTKT